MNWLARFLHRTLPAAPATARLESSPLLRFLETSRIVSAAVLAATVLAIVAVSYVGVSPIALPLQENQLASVRIVAAETFTYTSALRTRLAREQAAERVPPVFRVEIAPLEQFATHLREFAAELDRFEQQYLPGDPIARAESLREHASALAVIVEAFNVRGPYHVASEDIALLLRLGPARVRFALFQNGLATLQELYREGIYDNDQDLVAAANGSMTAYQVRGADGAIVQARVQSREDALTILRINLNAEGVGREGANALFHLFRNGLTANLVFDSAATGVQRARAAAAQKEVVVTVQKGQVLVDPGARITAEQYEQLAAHRQFLLNQGGVQVSGYLQLFGRMLLVLAMVLAAVIYIRLEDRASLTSNTRLALLGLVIVLNLSLVRTVFQLGEMSVFVRNPNLGAMLPYLAPTALAPLIVAVLLGTGPAIMMALVVSLFTAVIYGNRLDILVVTFFASMVGIFACRRARQRSRVIRAGFLAGLSVAGFALLLGAAENIGTDNRNAVVIVLRQMGVGLAVGVATGMAVVGLLPLLEMLFRRTTDITLLELTDYNHPLLSRLQIDAPGTYHHSLMVANLSENAAQSIGANPLVCRVCALFHDIGKTTKPEYFTENQRDRANPHDDCSPQVSAAIIRSHIPEGVDLALRHRLPRLVVDAIRQHHGTTLIQFFYQRARKELRAPAPGGTENGTAAVEVPEAPFRYEGPKPQTRENAILFFADCVEAASRSLRAATRESLAELVDRLFQERMEDGQLDECPLTFAEVAKIKTSFEFTLLNMLHSRIAYPAPDTPATKAPAPEKPASGPLSPTENAREKQSPR
ncbi:MAG: HDIG domain-containing protein [Opitutaceae bacterium]